MLEKIKKWWQRIPEPESVADRVAWQEFIKKAKRWQLEELYEREALEQRFETFVLVDLLKQLWQVKWPVWGNDELEKYGDMTMLKLPFSSIELAAAEHKEGDDPKYLIDVNNQILGIVLSRDCVITKLYNQKAFRKVAIELQEEFLTDDEVKNLVMKNQSKISNMLAVSGMGKLHENYWVRCNDSIRIWNAEFEQFSLSDNFLCAYVLGKEIF